jgi:outer membrane phospholipase A
MRRGRYLLVLNPLVLALTLCATALADENTPQAVEDLPDEVANRVYGGSSSFKSYRPNYFGYTVRHSNSDNEGQIKFQLSLKYEVRQASDVYFAYTQKSFWNIQQSSAPFAESDFSPEVFYLLRREDPDNVIRYVQFAAQHESTGEDGSGSHGWNIFYIEPTFVFLKDRLVITPKLWFPPPWSKSKGASDNQDIFKYYGYGQLSLVFRSRIVGQHSFMYRHGREDFYGFQYQWDIRPDEFGCFFDRMHDRPCDPPGAWNPQFFLQIWHGYGENLKHYNVSTSSIVLGISAIR